MRCPICGNPKALTVHACDHSYRPERRRRSRAKEITPAEVARRMRAAAKLLDGVPNVLISVRVKGAEDLPTFGRPQRLRCWRDKNSSHGEVGTVSLFAHVDRALESVDAETDAETLRLPPAPAVDAPRALPPARPLLALPPRQGQVALPGLLLPPGPDGGPPR